MLLTDTQPAAPGRLTRSAVSVGPEEPPAQWHRVLTLLADISLFIGTRSVWAQAATHRLPVAVAISTCYASILVCGVLVLVVRRRRALARLDLVVLVTAVTLVLCTWVMNHHGSDEADLTAQAARELVAGHAVYGHPWPWLFGHQVALTPTVTGGYDYTYGYPPLAPLLTAPLLWLGPGGVPATAVATGALVVGAVVLWRLLPGPWRSSATMVCLGFGMLPTYGRLGYPAVLALALLVPVVVRWPRIGRGGRLGPVGLARATCLGAACAAQQLPWFLVPFLLAGIYAVRRGELGSRAAALVVLRVVGVAVTVWLLINTYFVVSEPGAWFTGVALPPVAVAAPARRRAPWARWTCPIPWPGDRPGRPSTRARWRRICVSGSTGRSVSTPAAGPRTRRTPRTSGRPRSAWSSRVPPKPQLRRWRWPVSTALPCCPGAAAPAWPGSAPTPVW
ncbi:hypothetical protein SALBM311S_03988 [Streptomyces alboniger]